MGYGRPREDTCHGAWAAWRPLQCHLSGAVEGPRMEGVLEREVVAKGMTREQIYQDYTSGTSMGRFVEAQDITNMAVFLASDAARLVSGQVIAVDGHTVNPDPKL